MKTFRGNSLKLTLGTLCLIGGSVIFNSPQAQAASVINSTTPASVGSAVQPGAYNVFLETGDPLTVTVDVTVPLAPTKLDLFLLEDLSGSFGDDLFNVRSLVPSLVSSIRGTVADSRFGVGSFVDKPISPFGSSFSGDYVYRTDLALTTNTGALQSTVNGLSIRSGGDGPESSLEALFQTAVRGSSEIGFRNDAFKVVILSTDADFHQAGDFLGVPANNGDAVLDGTPPGTGEDYPSIFQVRQALQNNNIIPIFAVTSGVTSTYQDLVDDLGFGTVVTLSSNSSNIVSAINAGLTDVFKDITLTAVGDENGYVRNITPGAYSNVPAGDTRTFSVELLADGIDDVDDSFSLVAPGFGSTLVNVDVRDGTTAVPEPTTVLGTLAFGALGGSSWLKRRKKQTV